MQEVKWAMLAAQIMALLAWLYLRRCAPVERFWLDNLYVTGHLLVAVGLLGPSLLRVDAAIAFGGTALALSYNFLRYGREYRNYTYLPVEVRQDQPTTAGRLNQIVVTTACWIGAVALMGMTLITTERDFSRLTFLTFVPGLSGAIAAPSEAYHRRRRAQGLR